MWVKCQKFLGNVQRKVTDPVAVRDPRAPGTSRSDKDEQPTRVFLDLYKLKVLGLTQSQQTVMATEFTPY